jgi:hypothetical protein
MNPLVATQIVRNFFRALCRNRFALVSAALLGLAAEASAAAAASVSLAWNANSESNIAGYRLQYGTTSGVYPNSLDVGKVTTATADGLNPGDTYYFVVVAYNTAGQTSPPSAQVSYTVPGTPNTAPSATAGSLTVLEDGQSALTLDGSDPEGDALTFTVVANPTKGTLSGTPPNLTYKPNANANGSDSFTFRASDGLLNSATATYNITITPVNDAPVATARTIATNEDTSVAATLSGTDIDGNTLTFAVVANPTKGTLSGTAPNLTYKPNANVSGTDSFTFQVNDGTVNSATATVTINIAAVNDAPVASGRTATTAEDSAVAVTLAATDVENSPLTYTIVTQPANGTLSGSPPTVTYTPKLNFNGSDSFTFRASDGSANSANATVNLTVTAVNDPPVASALSVNTRLETAVAIKLAGTDVENNPLTFAVVTQPSNGTLSGSPPNLSYLPKVGYTGNDSFTYRANDGSANSPNATVLISVSTGNSAPVAQAKSLTTMKGKAVQVELSATDADSNPLSYRVVAPPASGTLTGTPPSLSFKPASDFIGDATFTYVANDGTVDSAPATVRIKVKASNTKPLATGKAVTVNWNTGTVIPLAGTDADSDPLSFSIVKQTANGTLSGTPPNVTYTPNSGFRGKDAFTFVANDGVVGSAAATVEITVVNPNNRAPVAVARNLNGPMKTPVTVTLAASDADADPLTYRIVTKPAVGRLTGKAPNLVYKPKGKFSGVVSFTYVAHDGAVDSAPVTVTITIAEPQQLAARSAVRTKATVEPGILPTLSLSTDPARPGVLGFDVSGPPGGSYILEVSPDLSFWTDDRVVTLDESGSASFEMSAPAGSKRGFFRLRTD